MDRFQLIAELSNAFGPSGFEDDVIAVAKQYLPHGFDSQRDSLLNLYARFHDSSLDKPVVMLDAHTDEVGFMVYAIQPNGQISFVPIGGWVPNTVPAHAVHIRNIAGEIITGIVASKPPHFMSESEKKTPLDIASMTIDIGATSAAEVREIYGVEVGDPIVPDTVFQRLENGIMMGKAFDCRLGCASAVTVLDAVAGKALAVNPVMALASQEEVGMRGAQVTPNTVKPAAAIVFEGTPADDNFAPSWQIGTAIKKGPMLRHIDNRMITNPRFLRFALDTAKESGIPVQHAVRTGGGTNGAPIHLAQQGIPTIVIGLPVRYIHSHYGLASEDDFQNSVQLAIALLERLDDSVIASF